jgi:hypothetical protein
MVNMTASASCSINSNIETPHILEIENDESIIEKKPDFKESAGGFSPPPAVFSFLS